MGNRRIAVVEQMRPQGADCGNSIPEGHTYEARQYSNQYGGYINSRTVYSHLESLCIKTEDRPHSSEAGPDCV